MKKQSVMSIIGVGAFVLAANAGSADAASSPNVPLFITASVAAKCVITSTADVAFGAYDPVVTHAATGVDLTGAAGTVSVQCTKNSGLTIYLDAGANSSGTQRRMAGGPDFLNYDLFTDASRILPWGIGATNPLTIPVAPSTAIRPFSVFGRVPKGQSVGASNFSDTIQATVNF